MSWIKSRWKPLTAAAVVLLALAWYCRPVDIYSLSGVENADFISICARPLGPSRADPAPIKDLSPEDPEWAPALEAIESLRFRRPPWNLVLQFIPERVIYGHTTHEGDYHVLFMIFQKDRGYTQVQFFVDEWTCSNPLPFSFANRHLKLWVKDSRETGNALAETILPLLEE